MARSICTRSQSSIDYSNCKILPPQNENFTGRRGELEEISEGFRRLHEEQNQPSGSHVIWIHGLGGVGKSQLALEYAHIHRRQYEFIRWIRCGPNSLEASILDFAKDLNINTERADLVEIMKSIFSFLFSDTWLLIFDNVVSDDDIKQYMPDLESLKQNQHIIITSVNSQGTPHCLMQELRVEEDAHEYVSSRRLSENRKLIKNLTKELGYLPLALSQAVAYIRQNVCTIEQYTKRLRQNRREFLTKDIKFENHAKESVYVCLITSILSLSERFPSAHTFLKYICVLDSENIPLILFENTDKFTGDALRQSKENLKEYSLVSECPPGNLNYIRVHTLVQAIVQDYCLEDPRQVESLIYCQEILNSLPRMFAKKLPGECTCISWSGINKEVLQTLSDLLPHAKCLLEHITTEIQKPALQPAQQKHLFVSQYTLLHFIGFASYFCRETKSAAHAFDELVKICCRLYRDSFEHAEALLMLGKCKRFNNNYFGSNESLIEAKNIVKGLPKKARHFKLYITILTAIGRTIYMQQLSYPSRMILEKAKQLQSTYQEEYSTDGNNVSDELLSYILCKLGDAYLDEKSLDKAKKSFEHCLAVREKLYEEGHILIALCRFCLGKTQLHFKEFDKAEESFRFCLERAEWNYGKRHSYVGKVSAVLGLCLLLKQNHNEAQAYLSTAEKILKQSHGAESDVYNCVRIWQDPEQVEPYNLNQLRLFYF